MINYNRFKDTSPDVTIQVAKNILNYFNIKVEEGSFFNPTPYIYSIGLRVPSMNLSAYGKGTTKEYCLASAYGELLEYLLNVFFRLKYVSKERVFDTFYDEIDFVLSRDINFLPSCIKEDLRNSFYVSDKRFPSDDELIEMYQNIFGGDVIKSIPYYDVSLDCVRHLPYELLSLLSRTNGMACGNTLEEATAQAICEVFERYAMSEVINKSLTPPEISIEYIKCVCPCLYDVINFISECGYEITFYDCSLGVGLPVVCVLLVNKSNNSYKVNFGSHLSFNIAVERCLTEILQGCEFMDSINLHLEEFNTTKLNIYNGFLFRKMRTNNGPVPLAFFKNVPSWKFKPWTYDTNNNKEIVNTLIKISLNIAPTVYIRNNTCMGLTAVRVYIPNLSVYKNTVSIGFNTYMPINERHVLENYDFDNICINCDELDSYERIIKNNYAFIKDRVGINSDVMLASIAYDKGNVSQTIELLKTCDSLPLYAKILLNVLTLKEQKLSKECIHQIIIKFYNQDDIKNVYSLLSGKSLFESILKYRKAFECNQKNYNFFENNIMKYIKFYIEYMKENPINQFDIRNMLHN